MKFIDPEQDRWRPRRGDDDAAAPAAPLDHTLLDIEQWRTLRGRGRWPAGLATGVIVPNDTEIEALAADLPRLQLVVLQFPKFTDGRAYTQARLLRGRWRYRGQVRAAGDVLVDMLPLLQRTGFDAVQLRRDQSVESARRALGFISRHYQRDVHLAPLRLAAAAGVEVAA